MRNRPVGSGLKAQIRRCMPKTVRSHRILAGRLRGYRIVTSWHDYPGAILGRTEQALLRWFEQHVRTGQTWLDVGAHYGYTAIALSRLVGPAGRVFAFEPEVATAGCLGRTRDVNHLPQLIVIPMGLADPPSMALHRLPVVRGMVDRTLEGDAGALSAFLTARLDWLWDQICGDRRRIDGIKIDVQGMELEVLRGMTALLTEFAPLVVVEVHRGIDRSELLGILEAAGYARHGEPIEPGATDGGSQYLDDRSYSFKAP
jgi:FkbM family methyltransferase